MDFVFAIVYAVNIISCFIIRRADLGIAHSYSYYQPRWRRGAAFWYPGLHRILFGYAEYSCIYTPQVPRVETFSESSQLHGALILELKKKWPCTLHLGENGDAGYCYISPNAVHIGLNNRKLKIWASAIVSSLHHILESSLMSLFQAAADATKHEPPSTVDFDGIRDGRIIAKKPRGRTGPRAQEVAAAPTTDTNALLMAAVIPLLTRLSEKRPRSPSPSRQPAIQPSPSTPCRSKVGSLPFSPIPGRGSELRTCLSDFTEASGLDLTACEDTLMERELTPDIIPDVPVDHLCTITGAVEGRIWKFQVYCKRWNACLDAKREEHAEKRRRTE